MRIRNLTKENILCYKAILAKSFFARAKGLLGRKHLDEGEALVITQCQAIHMFFMRFSIDVVFVDKTYRVVGLVKDIPPFFLSPIFFKAYFAVELAAGVIARTRVSLGDVLSFEKD